MMVNSMIKIRKIKPEDFERWLVVYHYYADHYKIVLTEEGIKTTWEWLLSDLHPLEGLLAEKSDHLVGLAHFRAMPSPLRGRTIGFLDDLVVVPESRGTEAARLLLAELRAIGERQHWDVIRWITKDDNYRARGLYDQVALKTDWNLYEMAIKIDN